MTPRRLRWTLAVIAVAVELAAFVAWRVRSRRQPLRGPAGAIGSRPGP